MKKLLLMFVIALMSLPMVVMGQCGTENLTATADDVTYQSLKVGPHCWMQTNLRTNVPGSFVYRSDMYPDEAANEETFGRLYPWAVAAGNPVVVGEHGFVQGVCPEGWHLPLPVEVQKLASFGATDIHSTEEWLVPGTDATGFGLLPSGFYNDATHRFENLGGEAYLWSVSTANEPVEVWSNCYCELLVLNSGKVNNGLSVRCVYKIYEAQVNTQMATNIKAYQADLNGDVVFAGYDVNFTRGFLYGTDANALSNDTVQTGQSEEGTYSFTVKDLQPNTTYYYRAYVINEFDTTFGQMMSFTTPVMTVTTDSANTITMHTAKVYGNVTSMGGYETLNAGFLYGTSRDALTSTFNYTDDITATGSYNGTLSELIENTTYYFCAFLTNGEQTVYGDTLDFTTPYLAVTTDSASAITTNAASIYGNLTNLSGYTSANVGFLYGTDESLGNVTTETSQTSAGSYNVALNDLTPNTKYYYCAYAINGVDTVYGDTLNFTTLETFTCGTSTVKDHEDNVYTTVKIGNQCWTKQNMRAKTSPNGTLILETPPADEVSYTGKKAYYPQDNVENAATYGLLYNWNAAVDTFNKEFSETDTNSSRNLAVNVVFSGNRRGICPQGWHVPSSAEWALMMDTVKNNAANSCGGSNANVANALASGSWTGAVECGAGNETAANANQTGFSALPAGYCFEVTTLFGSYAGFWTATQRSGTYTYQAFRYRLSSTETTVDGANNNKSNAFSVRCLRDAADGSELGENESNDTPEEPAATFTCGTSTVKDVDNNEYNTVQIGDQCWMKESLKTTKYADGTTIPQGSTLSSTDPYWYYPDDNSDNKATYGLLYNWPAVMNGATSSDANPSGVQGICPTGWHVPSDAEWTQLTNYVSSQSEYQCGGSSDNIAKALASTTGWNTSSVTCAVGNDLTANNATGFSAVPAGYYYNSGYYSFGYYANFWSATQYSSFSVYTRSLNTNYADVYPSNYFKHYGFSVRCVKDAEPEPETAEMSVTTDSANTVTSTAATLYGNVTDLGGNASVNAGFKYGTSETAMNTMADDAVSATGLYSINITDLTANTTYYYTAYVATATDTAYGDTLRFRTLSINPCLGVPTIKDVDNNTYNTVQIGDQCWMAQNLRTTTINGYGNVYTNPAADVETYGRYYDWAAVMQGATSSDANPSGVQGICPTGWHVPSDAEWTQLTNYVNTEANGYRCVGDGSIAKALSSTTGWNTNETKCAVGNTPSNNNATGFTAVPAGYYSSDFNSFGDFTVFWAATQYGSSRARTVSLKSNQASELNNMRSVVHGCSVRCVKDAEPEPETAEMSVTTDSANTVTSTAATLYGNVTDLGGNTSVNAGFKYGTSETAMNTKADDAVSATGLYSINITDLTANTTYYYTAYVATATDTAYGDTLRFRTLSINPCLGVPTIKDVDNNTYNTIQIGDQCWMAENLRTSTTTGNTYHANNNASNDETYGLLYDWAAVMQGATSSDANPSGVQGICPTGWHVPSNAEWTQLTNYVSSQSEYVCGGNSEYIAKALASTTGWKSSTGADWDSNTGACVIGNTPEANNTTGFSAVPAGHYSNGYGYYNVGYNEFGDDAYFWSATQKTVDFVYIRDLYYNNPAVFDYYLVREFGFSVRCVKDAEPETFTCGTSTVKDVDNNEYNTVQIGDQCWMKENLRTSTTTGNTYHANNNADNDEAYGLLYDWTAVMQGATSSGANPSGVQGICPTGWHVPSDAEWMQMEMELGMSQSDANKHGDRGNFAVKLSGSTGWTSSTVTNAVGNPSATDRNSTGFSALPAGSYTLDGYGNFGDMVLFWSATAYNDIYAYLRYLGYANVGVYRNPTDKGYGYSVRCLKN